MRITSPCSPRKWRRTPRSPPRPRSSGWPSPRPRAATDRREEAAGLRRRRCSPDRGDRIGGVELHVLLDLVQRDGHAPSFDLAHQGDAAADGAYVRNLNGVARARHPRLVARRRAVPGRRRSMATAAASKSPANRLSSRKGANSNAPRSPIWLGDAFSTSFALVRSRRADEWSRKPSVWKWLAAATAPTAGVSGKPRNTRAAERARRPPRGSRHL